MAPHKNECDARQILVTLEYTTVRRGPSLKAPQFDISSTAWTTEVNPEGSSFYVNQEKRAVTDVPIQCLDVVSFWIAYFDKQIKACELPFPDDFELYLEPNVGQSWRYYFVDHVDCTIFWLEDVDPCCHDLGRMLIQTYDAAYSAYLLEEQYCTHCEFFPHRAPPPALRDELIRVMNHPRANLLTSNMSTFPYSAGECKEFLDKIKSDTESIAYTDWTIARLWAVIARYRYNIFCGEDYARISRDQGRCDKSAPRRFAMSIGLTIIGNISALRTTNAVSASFGSFSSLAIGSVLAHRYAAAKKFRATEAAVHLSQIEHPTKGFEPIAAMHCLPPRAPTGWSMIFVAGHFVGDFLNYKNVVEQAPTLVVSVFLAAVLVRSGRLLRRGFEVSNL
ncbi:hypothetical protein BD414DRAFT_534801 [Trametes punicea]|nr:hypothetical protein BD414DRAFT_534801 [Trametes punicea]